MTEWIASDYHQHSSLQQAMAEEQLRLLSLRGDEHVLDVGCGDGKITAAIAARVPTGSVLGVDPSRDMIGFATSHFGPPANANLRFEVADARQLTYKSEFDLVVSFNALHWVPEQAAALRAIRTALKPGGQALLRMVPEGRRTSLEDVIEEVRNSARWGGYFSNFRKPYAHFSLEAYRALADLAGFQVLRLSIEDKAWDFETREAFVAFARATFVAWTQHLPASDHDAFIIEVLDRYRPIAVDRPAELNTFKFYQMEASLAAV